MATPNLVQIFASQVQKHHLYYSTLSQFDLLYCEGLKMIPASAPAIAHVHSKRGGLRAALFINGVQVLETTAIAAVGNNLITYILNDMHYSLSKSANIVTNFVGTTFLFSILGGFLSDSYLGSFVTIIIFGLIELTGYIVIAVQAHVPSLKPRSCDVMRGVCEEAKGVEAVVLYVGLYTIAVGSGCLKPNTIAYGGDQLENGGRRAKYFNMAYLSFCVGEVIALTLLVWIQSRYGMDVGFGVSAGLMFFALLLLTSATPFYLNRPPQGSIFTHILQVLVVVAHKKKLERASNQKMLLQLNENTSRRGHEIQTLTYLDQFRFPEQNAMGEGESREVEQVKLLIRVMPIFGCTILTNCILAQLQTFSVEQASSMESRVRGFQVPAASMQAIPYIIMVGVVPLYDMVFVPMLRRLTGKEGGISQLQRIGIGLFVSTLSMVTAAVVESKRKAVAAAEPPEKLSILWVAPQFIIYGFSEMFTAVGLLEFFYSQSVAGMQSFLTALTYCSYSFGFFLSSALVSLVNVVTKTRNQQGWLSHNNLNEDHLDLFYWLLSALSFLNFFNYLFWSRWFKYHPTQCQG